jgi:hypothetical protein
VSYSPGFSKPTHGYGLPFGDNSANSPDQAGPVTDFEAAEDLVPDNWAGEGYDTPCEPQ